MNEDTLIAVRAALSLAIVRLGAARRATGDEQTRIIDEVIGLLLRAHERTRL
jgi:hypothetical protein